MRIRDIIEGLAPYQNYDLEAEGGYGFAGQEVSIILSKDSKFIVEGDCFEELLKKLKYLESSNGKDLGKNRP